MAEEDALIRAFRPARISRPDGGTCVRAIERPRPPHELRRRAKIINYALFYGKTAFTLAKDIGVTPQAAQEFIDAYFAGFPSVRAFIDLDDCPGPRLGRGENACMAVADWFPS